MEKKHIISLYFNRYPTELKLSEAQSPKYFEWNGVNIAAKHKKIWKKLLNRDTIGNNWVKQTVHIKHLKDEYKVIGFKGDKTYSILYVVNDIILEELLTILPASYAKRKVKYIVCTEINDGNIYSKRYEKVLANPTQAGKSKYISISGQNFFAKQNEFISSKMVLKLKDFYYRSLMQKDLKQLQGLRKFLLTNTYPLIIELEIVDTIKHHKDNSNNLIGRVWDVDNRAYPYNKTFLDFLTKGVENEMEPFLVDDDRLRVRGGSYYFTPCDIYEDRKLVFHFYTTEKYTMHDKIINFLK